MTTNAGDRCPIWPDYPADRLGYIGNTLAWRVDSPRAGGLFDITEMAKCLLDEGSIDAHAKARLTTRLIDYRKRTGRPLRVDQALLKEAMSGRNLEVSERVHRLLECLVESSRSIGHGVCLFHDPRVGIGAAATRGAPYALACSESTTDGELGFLRDELIEKQWVRPTRIRTDRTYRVKVTGQGYEALRKPDLPDSSQAFVAMWLDKSMDDVYDNGFRPAIEDAGYKAVRIDRQPNVDKIDDAIMAAIRQSRFVLADFTHGHEGVRGSVYFEVGFARGLDIEVVSTCREDQIDNLHFDTRQYYHIAWKPGALDQLRREVVDRIQARAGTATARRSRADS